MSKKPTVLMILDGYGLNDKVQANAIAEANTPVMDRLMKEYPFVKGYASGMAVGLPDGQMGNSEVGHINMGAGRIVYQELLVLQKKFRMETSSRTLLSWQQLIIVREIIQTFIFTVCFRTVVFTATIHICMHCLRWRRSRDLQMFMFMLS
jgi:hypothetical protein